VGIPPPVAPVSRGKVRAFRVKEESTKTIVAQFDKHGRSTSVLPGMTLSVPRYESN
jgi:hypothetical protein